MASVDVLSLAMSTMLALLFVLVVGLGKLVPSHPMYQVMQATFEKAIDPLCELSATSTTLLRM